MRLRVELYTAAQTLTGEDAAEFWRLIEEIHAIGQVQRGAGFLSWMCELYAGAARPRRDGDGELARPVRVVEAP